MPPADLDRLSGTSRARREARHRRTARLGGVADSLHELKAPFRVGWERQRPLSEGGADVYARLEPFSLFPRRTSGSQDSCKRKYGISCPESGVQLTLAPENLTTLAHFSVSSTTNFANSGGAIDIGSAPRPASRAFNLGSARATLISLLSFSTISVGVFFGTPTPAQNTDSAPGTKSPMVGTCCGGYRQGTQ